MHEIGKGYKAVKRVGYHDGHFWRHCGGVLSGAHALNIALGAAYGCNGDEGPARRGIDRTELGYDIYRGSDDLLYAVCALDAWQVESI